MKKDIEQYKKLPDRKSRAAFLFDYYKIPITAIIIGLLSITLFLFNDKKNRETDMYAVLLNNDSIINACDPSVFETALKEAGYKGNADINDRLSLGYENNESADIETLQVLNALFTLGDLDLYIAPKQYFDLFAQKDGFADLRLLIDKTILEKADLYRFTGESGNEVTAGIILHPGSKIHEAGYYHDDVIVGVAVDAVHMDAALSFIEEICR